MLVLSRQTDQSIMLNDNVEVIVVDVRGDKVRLGIEHPNWVAVHRKEIYNAIQREKAENAERKLSEAEVSMPFCCSGAYDSKNLGITAYLHVSESGNKLDCRSLEECNCHFYNPGNKPNILKKCPFGIEKFVE